MDGTRPEDTKVDLAERLRALARWDKERQVAGPSYHAILEEAAAELDQLLGVAAMAMDDANRISVGREKLRQRLSQKIGSLESELEGLRATFRVGTDWTTRYLIPDGGDDHQLWSVDSDADGVFPPPVVCLIRTDDLPRVDDER